MITSDRDVFIAGHITQTNKDRFRMAAARRGMSMSKLLSDVVETFLSVEDETANPAVERALSNEQDVPLPLSGENETH